jgi:co-chaperonin GroES (HSP10)
MIDAKKLGNGGGGLVPQVKAKTLKPIHNRVIVKNMHFGDTTTNGGIIVLSDDGKDRGIKPRWGQVFSKGDANDDPYDVGDWILVEHGRWTRSFDVDLGDGELVRMRTVEAESVLLWDTEKPEDILFGDKSDAGDFGRPTAEDFGAR